MKYYNTIKTPRDIKVPKFNNILFIFVTQIVLI